MNNSTVVFAFDDDFSMGVLLSRAHGAWAWARSSTLEDATCVTPPHRCSMTFPWPDPADGRRSASEWPRLSRRLLARRTRDLHDRADRADQALQRRRRGRLDRPQGAAPRARRGRRRLLRLAEVGRAGRRASWSRRLTELNREISEGRRPYAPFA